MAAVVDVTVTPESLRRDAEAFSKEHSWYKHLDWPSTTFVMGFVDCAVIREHTPNYKGPEGPHLVLMRKRAGGFLPYGADAWTTTVALTPMLRGIEPGGHIHHAFFISERDSKGYRLFLREHGLVDVADSRAPEDFNGDPRVLALWRAEHARMIDAIIAKATELARASNLMVDTQ
jgi:hypothetical protein